MKTTTLKLSFVVLFLGLFVDGGMGWWNPPGSGLEGEHVILPSANYRQKGLLEVLSALAEETKADGYTFQVRVRNIYPVAEPDAIQLDLPLPDDFENHIAMMINAASSNEIRLTDDIKRNISVMEFSGIGPVSLHLKEVLLNDLLKYVSQITEIKIEIWGKMVVVGAEDLVGDHPVLKRRAYKKNSAAGGLSGLPAQLAPQGKSMVYDPGPGILVVIEDWKGFAIWEPYLLATGWMRLSTSMDEGTAEGIIPKVQKVN